MALGVPILKHIRVTNVVRTCGPTHLLLFDFMSNKICVNHMKFGFIRPSSF